MPDYICIVGYEQDGYCEHCGRPLKHCIRVSDGRIVGATCFAKVMTAPRQYHGKPYRLGAEEIIRLAKIAATCSPAAMGRRYGVYPHHLQFEIAAETTKP